jgi:methyltransferase OMS1
LHEACGGDLQGDVLEVSAGTGRNLPYYRYDKLNSLTVTDSSKYMLWHASQKYRDRQAAKNSSLPVSFFLSDAEKLASPQPAAAVPTSEATRNQSGADAKESESGQQSQVSGVFATRTHAYAENSFDTVVDTFGLCSHGNPVHVLKVRRWLPYLLAKNVAKSMQLCSLINDFQLHDFEGNAQEMGRVCKPDGKILLLEHGKANPNWLNKILDDGAHKHLMKWGCQWNKDIESIVKEVRTVKPLWCLWNTERLIGF